MTNAWEFYPVGDEMRAVRFAPAFHRCNDPKGNFGIGSVRMMWMLRVGDAGMGWDTHTDWGLPDAAFRDADPGCTHPRHIGGYPTHKASGGAVDFHMPGPRWEDHERNTGSCQFTGGDCWSDVGYILGSQMFDLLCTDGDEAVWKRLREMLDAARSEVIKIGGVS